MDFLRKTWAEIDTSALIYNLNVIKKASASQIIAVVKANAYGHATEILTPIMEEEGVDYFAVSNLDEALSLREIGIKKPIIITMTILSFASIPLLAQRWQLKRLSDAVTVTWEQSRVMLKNLLQQ